jgi:predicted nucleic acid-binding protein
LSDNGLGYSSDLVKYKTTAFEALFSLLPETPDIYPAWKTLVHDAGTIGKQVHDARLVAICHVHSISHVLTFNVRHFTPLAVVGPGITVVHPDDVTP